MNYPTPEEFKARIPWTTAEFFATPWRTPMGETYEKLWAERNALAKAVLDAERELNEQQGPNGVSMVGVALPALSTLRLAITAHELDPERWPQ